MPSVAVTDVEKLTRSGWVFRILVELAKYVEMREESHAKEGTPGIPSTVECESSVSSC